MKWVTTKDVANLWDITTRQVQLLCERGRIPGAQKLGHMWVIPSNAQRPIDGRTRQGRALSKGKREVRVPGLAR